MTEKTIFESEEVLGRDEAAARVVELAEKIREGNVSLSAGGQNTSLEIPEEVEFEVKVEEEGSETSIEIELEWDRKASGSLSVE